MISLLLNSHIEYLVEFQYILSLISHNQELRDLRINSWNGGFKFQNR